MNVTIKDYLKQFMRVKVEIKRVDENNFLSEPQAEVSVKIFLDDHLITEDADRIRLER